MSYEPGTRRMFVNDMHGALYTVSIDGKSVTPYFDHQDPRWNIPVQFQNFERGFQSFAFHPDFNRRGAPGYGKIYTYTDTSNVTPTPDWTPTAGRESGAPCRAPRVDGEESGSCNLRRRRTARADAVAASVRESQRRPARLQPDRAARQRRLRSAVCRQRRWRQRRRSDEPGAESGFDVRQDSPHRSARQEQRERQVRHSERQPVRQRQRSEHARRDLRVRRAQSAALRVGFEDRHDVHGRHRPGHRRGSDDRSEGGESRLACVGRQLQVRERFRSEPGYARAAIRR